MQDQGQSTKTESAYRLLRRDILATRLRPGAPMKLGALRDRYEIGWTPLREALSRLEAEGLVTAVSNRGFAVAPVSRAALEDLTRARMAVEIPLLLESIEYGGSEWESAVVTAHYRLSRCTLSVESATESQIDEWDEKHAVFHAALVGAARSSWLARFQQTISDQMRRHHRFLSLAPTLRAAEGLHEGYREAVAALHDAMAITHHTELMEAALDRDAARARTLMEAHIGFTIDVYARSEDGGHAAPAAPKARASK